MTRQKVRGPLLILALCATVATAQDPQWKLIRPTNTGITGDYCHTIFVDENDEPWIAGYIPFWEEGGVSHFDGQRWNPVSNADYPVIASPRFNDIVEDRGIMWIGTDLGLLRFDPTVGPDSLTRFDTANSPMLGNQVRDLDVAPDGTVWMALDTFGGTVDGGLAQYDPDANSWNTWDTSNGLPWGTDWPGWDWVDHVAIVPDQGGPSYIVWLDGPLGVATYDDGDWTWYDPYDPPPGAYPTSIYSNDPVDEAGNIWLARNPGVLGRLSPAGTWTVSGFPANLSTEVSRVFAMSGGRAILTTYYGDVFRWDGGWTYLGGWGNNNHTYAFAEESSGAFWVGGIGGAARYDGGFFQRYRLTNTGMVGFFISTIGFEGTGDVYMNGNAGPGVGGFDILHPDGTWTNANNATYGLGLPWGLPTDDVEDLTIRANGNAVLALAGIQGIVEWDGATYTYLTPQGYDFVEVAEDGAGRIWGARYANYGLFRITGPQQYTQYTSGNSPLPAGSISDLIPDPDQPGFVWVATQFGMAHTDGETWEVYPRELLGLDQNTLGYHITCADRADDGTLWIGSGIALFHFDPATSEYTSYDLDNTPLPSDDFWNIEVAPDGTLWVSTFDHVYPYPGGLSHFDGESWITYSQGSSPLPHNQIQDLQSRPIGGGQYELWVATASEAVAVLTLGMPLAGDIDGDGDLDLDDHAIFFDCMTGPGGGPIEEGCERADLDGDEDADLADHARFQLLMPQ